MNLSFIENRIFTRANERPGPVASSDKKKKNPFYTLLIWVGIVFALTATSYGVMTVTYLRASEEITESSNPDDTYHPLFRFLDENGFDLMLAELGLLGVLTFAAIAYDEVHDPDGLREQGKKVEEIGVASSDSGMVTDDRAEESAGKTGGRNSSGES